MRKWGKGEEFNRVLNSAWRAHGYLLTGWNAGEKEESFETVICFALCKNPRGASACRECSSCRYYSSFQHPDLLVVDRGEESSIGIEQSRALSAFLATEAVFGPRKVVLVRDAHFLTREAASALLKTFEEPKGEPLLLLESNLPKLLPDTLRSRVVEFRLSGNGDYYSEEMTANARAYLAYFKKPFSERLRHFENEKGVHLSLLLTSWELAIRDAVMSVAGGSGSELVLLEAKDVVNVSAQDLPKLLSAWSKVSEYTTLLSQGKSASDNLFLSALLNCFSV